MAAPGAPTSVVAALSGHNVVVTWVAPASDGGSALTRYDIAPQPTGDIRTTTPPTVTVTVGGLSAGPHTCKVRAVNADGASAYVESNSVEVPMTFASYWVGDIKTFWERNPAGRDVKVAAMNAAAAVAGAGFIESVVNDVTQAATGAAAGGEKVTIRGAGFTGAVGVKFGTTSATSVAVWSNNEIRCVTPAHAAGAVDVVVDLATDITATGGYTYV